jgi:hypothetical protein
MKAGDAVYWAGHPYYIHHIEDWGEKFGGIHAYLVENDPRFDHSLDNYAGGDIAHVSQLSPAALGEVEFGESGG